MDELVVGDWTIPAAELEERFETSGGPGGQHANRNETTVRLRFDIAASSLPEAVRSRLLARMGPSVEVIAGDHRSQSRNRETARDRLVERLEAALVVPKPRKKTRASRSSKTKRVEKKKARGQVKKNRRPPTLDD